MTAIDQAGGQDRAESTTDKAAKQLEAYFLRRVLSEIKSSSNGLLSGGFAGETFQQMLNEALADSMAEAGGLGISDLLMTQLENTSPGVTNPRPGRGASRSRASGARLLAPVEGTPSSGFGSRIHPLTGKRKHHSGLDIAAASGSAVHAAASGKVTRAGRAGGYGNLVVVTHEGGIETRYAHLSKIDVKVGQKLQAGARVGAVGSTGASTGPHLHFEVRQDGVALDPKNHLASALTPRQQKDGHKK